MQELARVERISFLRSILKKHKFFTQEAIVKAVSDAGFEATQSSISRDLKTLNVSKIDGRYIPIEETESFIKRPKTSLVKTLLKSFEPAGQNLLVVKTESGGAHVVAASFDGTNIDGLIGTVAGDDTFFIATKNKLAQKRVIEALKNL